MTRGPSGHAPQMRGNRTTGSRVYSTGPSVGFFDAARGREKERRDFLKRATGRERMGPFRRIVSKIRAKTVRFIPPFGDVLAVPPPRSGLVSEGADPVQPRGGKTRG
jgi:hypothetical protein